MLDTGQESRSTTADRAVEDRSIDDVRTTFAGTARRFFNRHWLRFRWRGFGSFVVMGVLISFRVFRWTIRLFVS